uniref:THAP domain-containing protein 1 n=1 Tax=Myripristis murdjan TaxID=586833 RepID=A0A667X2J1_9TELE
MVETCSVSGCGVVKDDNTSLHILPKDPTTRDKWVHFIWNRRSVPEKIPPKTRVCSSQFKDSCFENLGQKRLGFATKLILKHDAVPGLLYRKYTQA